VKVHVGWGNEEETFLVWKFHDGWTEQNYYESHLVLMELAAAKEHPIGIIVDLRHVIKAPPNVMTIVRHIAAKRPANIGQMVLLVASAFWQRIFDMERNIAPHAWDFTHHFAKTVDEAYQLIESANQQAC